MNAILQITLVNAASAAILALTAALAGRYLKRPAVLHTLWMLVLLQLFMPPVLEVGLLPGPAPLERSGLVQPEIVERAEARPSAFEPPAPEFATPRSSTTLSGASATAATTTGPKLGRAAFVIWIAGTAWVLGLVLARTWRFRRLLRGATTTDIALERRLAALAERMALRKPGLRIVRASVSPLVHPRLGGAELLFPSGLLNRLDAGEQDAILAHELAHVARRDHWVRLLELIAIALFWWHPAVWWARSRLRMAEERCCDQLVMRTLPHGRSSYARGLLKTVEFLAGTTAGVPALASGVGEVRDLKERLTMILKDRPPKSMSRTQRILLALCAASVLLIFPTWSEREVQAASPDEFVEQEDAAEELRAEAERDYVNQRRQLEQQAAELEHALRQIRERQAELEQIWRGEMQFRERDDVEADRVRAAAESARVRAEDMYERARALELVAEREARERDRMRGEAYRQVELEYSLQRKMRELEQAAETGDEERADELRLEIAEFELSLQETRVAREYELRQLEQARVEAKLDRLQAEAYEQREVGRPEIAERIEAQIEALERSREERIRRELEIRRLLEEIGSEPGDRDGLIR